MSERPGAAPSRELERHRGAWFAVAVIVILAAVVALEILDDAGPAPDLRATGPGDPATVPVTLRDALRTRTAAKPSDDVAASKRAARRFLAHYLPFTDETADGWPRAATAKQSSWTPAEVRS